jgi:hypothetical protein
MQSEDAHLISLKRFYLMVQLEEKNFIHGSLT